jgi:SRSO17 transposase
VWADDAQRRDKAHVPEAIRFKTKPQIALAQLGAALAAGVARGVVLMDASYGTNSALRAGIGALALTYVAAILPTVKVRAVADPDRRVSAKALALSLPKHAWRTITWRDGSAAPLRSRFARVRVRTAPSTGAAARPQETLLIEWPDGDTAPTKYWLSNIAETMSLRRLVDIAKLRWRIERDYQDLKQEIGLGHYEGRGWRGFHHHGTLCIAAYGFLISERATIPPSAPRCAGSFAKPAVSAGYRPRGAAVAATTPRSQLDRDRPLCNGGRDRPQPAAMPVLRTQTSTKYATQFMTQ